MLDDNFPNPFNPTTMIGYQLPVKSRVTLDVYDVLGRKMAALVHGEESAGFYKVSFDGSGLSSGVYFCRFTAGKYTSVKKMLMVK